MQDLDAFVVLVVFMFGVLVGAAGLWLTILLNRTLHLMLQLMRRLVDTIATTDGPTGPRHA